MSSNYVTQNVDLASFLVLHGLDLISCFQDPRRTRVVLFEFTDEKKQCTDLEMVYLRSEHKVFRDINKQLLRRVHDVLQ